MPSAIENARTHGKRGALRPSTRLPEKYGLTACSLYRYSERHFQFFGKHSPHASAPENMVSQFGARQGQCLFLTGALPDTRHHQGLLVRDSDSSEFFALIQPHDDHAAPL